MELLGLVSRLVVVALIFAVSMWALRRYAVRSRASAAATGELHVVSRVTAGKGSQVLLLESGDQRFLVGVGGATVLDAGRGSAVGVDGSAAADMPVLEGGSSDVPVVPVGAAPLAVPAWVPSWMPSSLVGVLARFSGRSRAGLPGQGFADALAAAEVSYSAPDAAAGSPQVVSDAADPAEAIRGYRTRSAAWGSVSRRSGIPVVPAELTGPVAGVPVAQAAKTAKEAGPGSATGASRGSKRPAGATAAKRGSKPTGKAPAKPSSAKRTPAKGGKPASGRKPSSRTGSRVPASPSTPDPVSAAPVSAALEGVQSPGLEQGSSSLRNGAAVPMPAASLRASSPRTDPPASLARSRYMEYVTAGGSDRAG